MKNIIVSICICVAILSVLAFFLFGFTGCKTFKPIEIKGIPPECNFSLNVIKLYYDSEDKSGAVRAIDLCFKVYHRERCLKDVYGKKMEIDFENYKKYKNYNECLKEID